jgi:hypothetical protein
LKDAFAGLPKGRFGFVKGTDTSSVGAFQFDQVGQNSKGRFLLQQAGLNFRLSDFDPQIAAHFSRSTLAVAGCLFTFFALLAYHIHDS